MTDAAKPRIAIGADHAGFEVKETVKRYLESAGYAVADLGTSSGESVDYPDFAAAVANRVAEGGARFGILACGSGIGMSIAANKVEGIRAALACDPTAARLSREHNDANVLALASRGDAGAHAVDIVKEFLAAQFAGGRHQRRVDKIVQLDQERERQHDHT